MNSSAPFAAYHPEILLAAVGAFIVLIERVFIRHREAGLRHAVGAFATVAACAGAAWLDSSPVSVTVLALTAVAALLGLEREPMHHAGEYHFLLLVATVGLLLIGKADTLLLAFLGLETASLSTAVLIAFDKPRANSSEAGLKYFLLASVAAACLLYGFSLLYGLTGTTHVPQMAQKLFAIGADPLVTVALVMVVIGFGFKIAAVPFHLWAPDAYQGAPLPCAAFIASGSKVASFYVFAKVMLLGFSQLGWGNEESATGGWIPLLSIIAAVSMVLGNLAAIHQTSVRRLLAYSAIAHAGYMLIGFLALGGDAFGSLLFYVTTYALTTVGAFGVLGVVEAQAGGDQLKDFAGLARRAPVLAWCLMVFLLSLAGIPPLAGFFGKFYLFAAALTNEAQSLPFLWLVILGIAMSCVSLYYYLQVLKQVFVVEADAEARPLAVPFLVHAVVVLLAATVVLLGCVPGWLLDTLHAAITEQGW